MGLLAATQADHMTRTVRSPNRLGPNRLRAMKRGNYWTLNSLGYHGGLGKLFKTKRNAEPEFAQGQPLMMRSATVNEVPSAYDPADYNVFGNDQEREEILEAAERELI